MAHEHPCLRCGACCAAFRVSFHWSESGPEPHQVPEHFTEQISPHRAAMLGTNQPQPRCIALLGQVGQAVRCSIYEGRSSPCRDFTPSWEDGQPHEGCDRARARWGLRPLGPEDWQTPGAPQPPDAPPATPPPQAPPPRRPRRAS